jgi:hypothetical protein
MESYLAPKLSLFISSVLSNLSSSNQKLLLQTLFACAPSSATNSDHHHCHQLGVFVLLTEVLPHIVLADMEFFYFFFQHGMETLSTCIKLSFVHFTAQNLYYWKLVKAFQRFLEKNAMLFEQAECLMLLEKALLRWLMDTHPIISSFAVQLWKAILRNANSQLLDRELTLISQSVQKALPPPFFSSSSSSMFELLLTLQHHNTDLVLGIRAKSRKSGAVVRFAFLHLFHSFRSTKGRDIGFCLLLSLLTDE